MNKAWWLLIAALLILSGLLRHDLLLLMTLILALLLGISQLWATYCLVNVTYRRELDRSRLFLGEETDLRVELVNAKPLPLAWLRADDEFPKAIVPVTPHLSRQAMFNRRRLVNVFSLRWYERVIRHYRIRGTERGAWEIGPVYLRSGDIFGFDIRRISITDLVPLIVYPRIVAITALGLPARHPFGELRSNRRLVEDPMRLMGAREYAQGDSFRHIHWKATARRQALQTKVFESSATRPIAIFLNVNTYEHYYQGVDNELYEYAITAAASIGKYVWEEGHALGIYTNALIKGQAARLQIAPRKHPHQLVRVLEALARIDGPGRWPIEFLIQSEAGRLAYGTTMVVISAIVTDRLRQTLNEMSRRQYGVVLITLESGRLERPIPGVVNYHIGGHEEWQALIYEETDEAKRTAEVGTEIETHESKKMVLV